MYNVMYYNNVCKVPLKMMDHPLFSVAVQWDPWHQAQSCEAFAQWKKDNNPEAQEQGLAAHLAANGIGTYVQS